MKSKEKDNFYSRKHIWKYPLQNVGTLDQTSICKISRLVIVWCKAVFFFLFCMFIYNWLYHIFMSQVMYTIFDLPVSVFQMIILFTRSIFSSVSFPWQFCQSSLKFPSLCSSWQLCSSSPSLTLKTQSRHDVNFVVSGGTAGATSGDKAGIMSTLDYKYCVLDYSLSVDSSS